MKKAIIEDSTHNLFGPKALSQKYNTMAHVICCFVREMGFHVTPDDMSNFPDFPKHVHEIA